MASIIVDYDFPHAPAKVWKALTEPLLVSKWLMPTDLKAEVGHRFTFTTQPRGDFDGTVRCEVLEVRPLERLVYSWKGGSLDTTVTWTLTPSGTGTVLRLEHAGFKSEEDFAFRGMGDGWRTNVAQRLGGVLAE